MKSKAKVVQNPTTQPSRCPETEAPMRNPRAPLGHNPERALSRGKSKKENLQDLHGEDFEFSLLGESRERKMGRGSLCFKRNLEFTPGQELMINN